VTFCTKGRIDYFGEIIDEEMLLNDYGKIIQQWIIKTQDIRREVEFDECVIMPNHIHILIIVKDVGNAGMRSEESIMNQYTKNHLSNTIQWLKAYITKEIR